MKLIFNIIKKLNIILCTMIIFFLYADCKTNSTSLQNSSNKSRSIASNPVESTQLEQISCNPNDCIYLEFNKFSEIDDKLGNLMSEGAGKILINLYQNRYKLNSEKLEDIVSYLREIAKRDGQISIEPLYIKERGIEKLDLPLIKDFGLTALDIYSRIRNTIKYRHTKNYNAKIIFHPKSHEILLAFFIHKSYGDICDTLYANCNEIEYLDDETFDLALSKALSNSKNDKKPVKVNFRHFDAKLFEAKLEIDNFKTLNQSARLFKWLILTEKTTKKPIRRERIIGLSEVISILNYSITLYDYYKDIIMYAPARNSRADIYYSGKEDGGKIESVIFYMPD